MYVTRRRVRVRVRTCACACACARTCTYAHAAAGNLAGKHMPSCACPIPADEALSDSLIQLRLAMSENAGDQETESGSGRKRQRSITPGNCRANKEYSFVLSPMLHPPSSSLMSLLFPFQPTNHCSTAVCVTLFLFLHSHSC